MSEPTKLPRGNHLFVRILASCEARRLVPCDLNEEPELIQLIRVRGGHCKTEEFAEVVSVSNDINWVEVEVGTLDDECAEEGFEGTGGVAGGILVNVVEASVGFEEVG